MRWKKFKNENGILFKELKNSETTFTDPDLYDLKRVVQKPLRIRNVDVLLKSSKVSDITLTPDKPVCFLLDKNSSWKLSFIIGNKRREHLENEKTVWIFLDAGIKCKLSKSSSKKETLTMIYF